MTSRDALDAPSSVPVIAPHGDVDIEALPALQERADSALAEHGALILDAAGISFADSSFLRLVFTLHDRGDLRIAAPSPTVRRLLQVVGADTFLNLYATVEAARSGPAA
ncbi:STAS domain-containing protein [Streptomyces sp. NPDC008163]|uniref:STAS domain-containing protein n=1 Tax=Streptomyces sp. NPDC008163 TaxID=3364818 RepID=UPI0036EAAAD8